MIQIDDLEQLIYRTIDLATPSKDSVVFGFLSVVDNPMLVLAVMQYVTRFYDTLLQTLPLTPVNRISLQMQRCFTEEEYYTVFNLRHNDFTQPIFKTLLITNHNDRLLFTRNRNASYEAYNRLLESWSKVQNSVLYSFLYGDKVSTTT